MPALVAAAAARTIHARWAGGEDAWSSIMNECQLAVALEREALAEDALSLPSHVTKQLIALREQREDDLPQLLEP